MFAHLAGPQPLPGGSPRHKSLAQMAQSHAYLHKCRARYACQYAYQLPPHRQHASNFSDSEESRDAHAPGCLAFILLQGRMGSVPSPNAMVHQGARHTTDGHQSSCWISETEDGQILKKCYNAITHAVRCKQMDALIAARTGWLDEMHGAA